MKLSNFFFPVGLVILGFFAFGCHHYDYFEAPATPQNPVGNNNYNNKNGNTLPNTAQNYYFENYNGFKGYLNEGTYLNIPSDAFVDANGYLVNGHINLEVKEVLRKSDMFFNNISTTADSELLQAGGILYIKATQNGNALSLSPGEHISAGFPVKGTPVKMQFYNGLTSKYSYTDWQLNTDSATGSVTNTKDSTRSGNIYYLYTLSTNRNNWVSAQIPATVAAPTTVTVHITNKGSLTGSMCALVFPTNSVAMMDADTGTNNFVVPQMPSGSTATLVIYSKINGVVYSAFMPITISANMNIAAILSQTSESQFDATLRGLD